MDFWQKATLPLRGAKRPETVRLDECDVAIHGQSFGAAAVSDDLSLGYPAAEPVRRIDYLLLGAGLSCREAAVLPTLASDHRPLAMTVALEEGPGTRATSAQGTPGVVSSQAATAVVATRSAVAGVRDVVRQTW